MTAEKAKGCACPVCGEASEVKDSRPSSIIGAENAIRRRRKCPACGFRFTTFERIESVEPWQRTAIYVQARAEINKGMAHLSAALALIDKASPPEFEPVLLPDQDVERQLNPHVTARARLSPERRREIASMGGRAKAAKDAVAPRPALVTSSKPVNPGLAVTATGERFVRTGTFRIDAFAIVGEATAVIRVAQDGGGLFDLTVGPRLFRMMRAESNTPSGDDLVGRRIEVDDDGEVLILAPEVGAALGLAHGSEAKTKAT